jgi:hypothetical protein
MQIWLGQFERLDDPSYWGSNPLGSFLFFFAYSYLITAFGLSLLIVVASPMLSRIASRLVTMPVFVILGGLLGWGLFAWTPDPLFFASCGALSAAICVPLCPNLFRPVLPKPTQDALAD